MLCQRKGSTMVKYFIAGFLLATTNSFAQSWKRLDIKCANYIGKRIELRAEYDSLGNDRVTLDFSEKPASGPRDYQIKSFEKLTPEEIYVGGANLIEDTALDKFIDLKPRTFVTVTFKIVTISGKCRKIIVDVRP